MIIDNIKLEEAILLLKANIEITSVASFGNNLDHTKFLIENTHHLEVHNTKDEFSLKVQEEITKSTKKNYLSFLHKNSKTLFDYLEYVSPKFDLCYIGLVGLKEEHANNFRNLLIYSTKKRTPFIIVDDYYQISARPIPFPNSDYKIITSNRINFSLYYLDIVKTVFSHLENKK